MQKQAFLLSTIGFLVASCPKIATKKPLVDNQIYVISHYELQLTDCNM